MQFLPQRYEPGGSGVALLTDASSLAGFDKNVTEISTAAESNDRAIFEYFLATFGGK